MVNLDIIFIHGWLFDSRIWHGLDEEFKGFKSVKLVDLPGYGVNKLSKENHNDFCKNLLTSINNKTIVVAWSYGAQLAFHTYLKYFNPDIKLVLINANLDIYSSDNIEFNVKNIDQLISNLKIDKNNTIKNFMYECVKKSKHSKYEFKEMVNKFKMNDFPQTKNLIDNLNEMKLIPPLKKISFTLNNVLSINTEKDQFINRTSNTIPEILIKDLGHIPFISGNKIIYKSIMDFI
tara:strand:- start:382 stop:1083 length:702 start_codon:yes stop_codon:yes gene_type:complete